MGKFLESEKLHQAKFKASSPYFSNAARADGVYKGKPRPCCCLSNMLKRTCFPKFERRHLPPLRLRVSNGTTAKMANPVIIFATRRVCCVNFLFAFSDKLDALAKVLRPVFPDIRPMLPVENGQYVAFEWIREENYLGEKISRNGKRTRGANFTSADAIVMFERIDGKRQIALIEWKYTESYGGASLKIAKSGTDRTSIYRPLFRRDNCPINKELLPNCETLFYQTFYQLMRQQFLAHEMERAQELGADIVCVLYIAPDHNADFRRVTSPDLQPLGDTVTDVWKQLVQPRYRVISTSTERLFGGWLMGQLPKMRGWSEYINARYAWVQDGTASPS